MMSYPGFIWKNGMRNKRRTLLTVVSVALALFVLTTLVAVVNQFERNLDETNAQRLITRHKVSLGHDLPERYGQSIQKTPGVAAMTTASWFGGLYIDRQHTDFAQFSCDPETLFDVVNEVSIPPDQKEAFKKERTAVAVGRRKAEKHGWKLGDRITLKGQIYPVDLELTVRGIFSGTVNQEAAVYFHRKYLEESLGNPGSVGTYWILVDSPESVARVSQAVDSMFENTDAPTKTETERAFQMGFIQMIGNLKGLVATIGGVIIFTILLVTANTMAMSVRERVREIAVLKTLGFRRRTVLALLMIEGALITLIGGLLGSLGARLVFGSADFAVVSQGFMQALEVTEAIIAATLGISALMGLIAAGIPALRATRLTVADGLRHVG
jgi:putative ABC transport system permease protein